MCVFLLWLLYPCVALAYNAGRCPSRACPCCARDCCTIAYNCPHSRRQRLFFAQSYVSHVECFTERLGHVPLAIITTFRWTCTSHTHTHTHIGPQAHGRCKGAGAANHSGTSSKPPPLRALPLPPCKSSTAAFLRAVCVSCQECVSVFVRVRENEPKVGYENCLTGSASSPTH